MDQNFKRMKQDYGGLKWSQILWQSTVMEAASAKPFKSMAKH